jgi:MarR family transcriptional regulator, organic hydroperoxide resistance regulator
VDAGFDRLLLDNQLCFAVYTLNNAMKRAYRPMLAELDLTYAQFLVMLLLWERDGQSLGEIGERLALDSGTLTPVLKRLEASGYVTRRRSAEDERAIDVRLTPKGAALRPAAFACRERIMDKLCLNDEQVANLRTELLRLVPLLGQEDSSFSEEKEAKRL